MAKLSGKVKLFLHTESFSSPAHPTRSRKQPRKPEHARVPDHHRQRCDFRLSRFLRLASPRGSGSGSPANSPPVLAAWAGAAKPPQVPGLWQLFASLAKLEHRFEGGFHRLGRIRSACSGPRDRRRGSFRPSVLPPELEEKVDSRLGDGGDGARDASSALSLSVSNVSPTALCNDLVQHRAPSCIPDVPT